MIGESLVIAKPSNYKIGQALDNAKAVLIKVLKLNAFQDSPLTNPIKSVITEIERPGLNMELSDWTLILLGVSLLIIVILATH